MPIEWSDARTIYTELSSLSAKSATPLNRLWGNFLKAAVRYAELRARWALVEPGEDKLDIDRDRTLAHNAFIDSTNAMSRFMASQGLDVSWRKRLGDQATTDGRKSIGDFACFVHCLLSLSAR